MTIKGLSTEWFKGLTTLESKESLAGRIRNLSNDIAIKRFIGILRAKEKFLLSGVGIQDYDSPSWSHKQADINGQLRSLRYVLDLLDSTKESDDQSSIRK